jgi:hypothetical protein
MIPLHRQQARPRHASEQDIGVDELRARRGCIVASVGVSENFNLTSSKSSAKDYKALATDEAGAATSGAVVGQDESQIAAATGAGSVVTLEGGLTQTGKGNILTLPGSVTAGPGFSGDITVTNTDPGLLSEALDRVADLNQDFISALTAGDAEQTGVLGEVLNKIVELSESKQTEGEAKRDTTLLYLVLGLAAAIVAVIYFWRR